MVFLPSEASLVIWMLSPTASLRAKSLGYLVSDASGLSTKTASFIVRGLLVYDLQEEIYFILLLIPIIMLILQWHCIYFDCIVAHYFTWMCYLPFDRATRSLNTLGQIWHGNVASPEVSRLLGCRSCKWERRLVIPSCSSPAVLVDMRLCISFYFCRLPFYFLTGYR